MYPKHKIEKIIDNYYPKLKKALGIKGTVNFHIYNSQSKKYKKLKQGSNGIYGFTLSNVEGSSDIFLFTDQHHSEREVLGTLFHELMHHRLCCITGLVTLNSNKVHKREERLVQDLERMFIKLFWDNKL